MPRVSQYNSVGQKIPRAQSPGAIRELDVYLAHPFLLLRRVQRAGQEEGHLLRQGVKKINVFAGYEKVHICLFA